MRRTRQTHLERENASAVVVLDGSRVVLRDDTPANGLVTKKDDTYPDEVRALREETKVLARRAKIGWTVRRVVESPWAAWPLEMERVGAAVWGHADDVADEARRYIVVRPPVPFDDAYVWPPGWTDLAHVASKVSLAFRIRRGELQTTAEFELQLLAGGVAWGARAGRHPAHGRVDADGVMRSEVHGEPLVHETPDAFASWWAKWLADRMDWIVADLR